jgi:hypothetical protein
MTMRERFKTTLIDPTWEEIVERDPLIAFSHYLCGRVHVLLAIGDEIVENLDRGFSIERVNGSEVERAESLMWLWTLGAYEVVRTMCQAKVCFSIHIFDELHLLKKNLSAVRMPAAKMEKPGKKTVPVASTRSASGWDVLNKDLLINDPEETLCVSARFLLEEFDRVMSSITKDDILDRHENSYSRIPNKPSAAD